MASRFTSSAPGPSAAKSKAAKAPRHTLSLKEKYDVIDTSNKNPGMGSRALAAMFSCGKSQIQAILNNKESIVELYESNMSSTSMLTRKRFRESDYSQVNEAGICWPHLAIYTLVALSSVKRPNTQIAEKLISKLQMDGWRDRRPDIMLNNFEYVENLGK